MRPAESPERRSDDLITTQRRAGHRRRQPADDGRAGHESSGASLHRAHRPGRPGPEPGARRHPAFRRPRLRRAAGRGREQPRPAADEQGRLCRAVPARRIGGGDRRPLRPGRAAVGRGHAQPLARQLPHPGLSRGPVDRRFPGHAGGAGRGVPPAPRPSRPRDRPARPGPADRRLCRRGADHLGRAARHDASGRAGRHRALHRHRRRLRPGRRQRRADQRLRPPLRRRHRDPADPAGGDPDRGHRRGPRQHLQRPS